MKKLFLVALLLTVGFAASAQTSKGQLYSEQNAIGLRLGYGADISYQRTLGSFNRFEADLGFTSYGFNLGGTYQWTWDIENAEGLGWYAGPGVTLGAWDNNFNVGITGQIGLEYAFDAPISLSIDWKPAIHLINDIDFGWQGFALGVRYRF